VSPKASSPDHATCEAHGCSGLRFCCHLHLPIISSRFLDLCMTPLLTISAPRYAKASLNGESHHIVTKIRTLRTVPVEGHGDDPGVMVMTLLSHSMTFPILSPNKFADVAGNLMLMIGLRARTTTVFLPSASWKFYRKHPIERIDNLVVAERRTGAHAPKPCSRSRHRCTPQLVLPTPSSAAARFGAAQHLQHRKMAPDRLHHFPSHPSTLMRREIR
jgi:hypothetical protein